MGQESERCGRCAMSSVVDAAKEQDLDANARAGRNPFDGDRIEVDDAELRRLSPGAWFGGVVDRLDDVATRLTYRR